MEMVRFAVSQQNYTVGDIDGNVKKIRMGIDQSRALKADVAVFPELSITGYPPEDLVFKQQFLEANIDALEELAGYTKGKNILCIVGFIDRIDNEIYNSAAVLYNGRLIDKCHKIYLPNYGVFDEQRYFTPGSSVPVYHFRGARIGVNICEDIWYPGGPLHYQALLGNAECVVNISASPFHAGKQDYREHMFRTRAGDESVVLINCNMTGGQDELVFDGSSSAYDENGELIMRMKAFEEDFAVFDVKTESVFRKRLKDIRRKQEREGSAGTSGPPFDVRLIDIEPESKASENREALLPRIEAVPYKTASIYQALVLGTRDYVNKNGFKNVIVAVSGGIDSALVAAVAADALGGNRVKGIYLPSQFSADISGEDAKKLCENLGIEYFEIAIKDLFDTFRKDLLPVFKDLPFSIAEENLQSRIRGNLVMAMSNKFGWLVLTTGNKSEMSAGYATLYGDMAGGFAVIKDVLKTTVYDLVEYRNRISPVIPERIITRPPTAELRENQKDSDSLPEYTVLDAIIRGYVEEDKPVDEIIREIGDREQVLRVVRLIDLSEYKRRQAPPGVKITPRAFGRDRRMPITNGFRYKPDK